MKNKLQIMLLLGLGTQLSAYEVTHYDKEIKPILEKLCVRCHGEKKQKGGFRIDQLADDFSGKKLFSWEKMQHVLTMPLDSDEVMPPEDSKQPTVVQRLALTSWISENLDAGRLRAAEKNGSVRRLTKSQYRNTLRDLLKLDENVGRVLPNDAVSPEGFTNDGGSMQLSPMQMESYFSIAQKALDLSVVNPKEKPKIQNFSVSFGDNINKEPIADRLILGAGSKQLQLKNFLYTELLPEKPFAIEPYIMKKKYRFVEGYKGNSTVRGWLDFDSIYHAVFAGVSGPRATYPKGDPINFAEDGMLMRPSIPAKAAWSPTMVWSPRFKISLRELPSTGNFKIKVNAAKYRDTLNLDKAYPAIKEDENTQIVSFNESSNKINLNNNEQFKIEGMSAGKSAALITITGFEDEKLSSFQIALKGKDIYLNLSEIEFFDAQDKKISNVKITMSSLLDKKYDTVNLTDGNKNNFAHTRLESNPWLKFEFPNGANLSSVKIYNRKGFEERFDSAEFTAVNYFEPTQKMFALKKAGVYQLDFKYLANNKNASLNFSLGEQKLFIPVQVGKGKQKDSSIVIKGSTGKEVNSLLIQVPGKDKFINLTQLEFFDQNKKAIKNTKITMSSTYSNNMGPDKLTDGNKTTLGHTQQEDNPWIKVVFDKPQVISVIKVYNRKDYEDRFDGAEFSYSQDDVVIAKRFLSDKEQGDMRNEGMKVLRLEAGQYPVDFTASKGFQLDSASLNLLSENSKTYKSFVAFEKRNPMVNLQMGFRRDDGSTLNEIGPSQEVDSYEFKKYEFTGSINDFPSPVLNKANANYLAGVREIGLRHDYVTEIDVPRLLVKSVEFEGPYYESWPTKSHKTVFIDSSNSAKPEVYAKEVIENFMFRAYRGEVNNNDLDIAYRVWQGSYKENQNFHESVKDALLVVLTSPQFLFITEKSDSPEKEALNNTELASKLSYFLWNSPPDADLLAKAQAQEISQDLNKQVDEMISDARFANFTERFTRDWLLLDKFDSVKIDQKLYPTLTKRMKQQLRQEPVEFINYLIQENLELSNIIDSDFTIGNDLIAEYYKLENKDPQGYKFRRMELVDKNRGGLLTQASILAGLSDGHESHPVKRGTWVARKIVAEPPGTPPPNVPAVDEEDKTLTLREKLEAHRNQKGCKNCHMKIDPWGIPFEMFDAAGFVKKSYESESELPDGTEVNDLNAMKKYLIDDRMDQVAFSFMKHLAIYATGGSLNFDEVAFLKENAQALKPTGYKTRDVLKFIINSHIFNTK
ncbi:DUF1592 domain-containing protein [Lentisphaera profundi]|uniref:DUF1592 domain-containing protein n=1 Tax=Lentisphaera profundi TaxID=1658616 RepID=A0ABY7VU88_9BACT|nr:DUF1592 domain-containing protein [Lentisphaera profundi]WDE97775.1 DUF1592 domain-containing protein [Lentisphaera profundi]